MDPSQGKGHYLSLPSQRSEKSTLMAESQILEMCSLHKLASIRPSISSGKFSQLSRTRMQFLEKRHLGRPSVVVVPSFFLPSLLPCLNVDGRVVALLAPLWKSATVDRTTMTSPERRKGSPLHGAARPISLSDVIKVPSSVERNTEIEWKSKLGRDLACIKSEGQKCFLAFLPFFPPDPSSSLILFADVSISSLFYYCLFPLCPFSPSFSLAISYPFCSPPPPPPVFKTSFSSTLRARNYCAKKEEGNKTPPMKEKEKGSLAAC